VAFDTYESCWRSVLLRCPLAGPFLSQQWVNYTFRQIAERRRWSWLMGRSQFLMNAVLKTGTVTVTRSSNSVVGSGTGWAGVEAGRQFRTSIANPIYTIASVDVAAQTLTLDDVWGGATASAQTYQIYNAYVTVPSDFQQFTSVWDTNFNWQLWLTFTQEDLNMWDAQRANSGTSYAVVPFDYDSVTTPPLPRYEIWPHQLSNYAYPFLYEKQATDLQDSGASLPRFIRGDVLLEGALEQAALWPGPSSERRNPYFNLALANQHRLRKEQMINELEHQDDDVYCTDVKYTASGNGLPLAPIPWMDSKFLQSHAI
jgi:hypothetical protein